MALKQILTACLILVAVFTILSATTLLVIWRDGSWGQVPVLSNCVITGAGTLLTAVLAWFAFR